MNSITLETNRLLLRGISAEYMKYLFNNCSKEAIKETLGHRSEDEFEKERYKHQNGYSSYNRSFIVFLLIDKESHAVIGRCGLHNWNTDHNRAEIGYVMTEENFKQKGLMSEAVKTILDYGFSTLKLHRIEALIGKDNVASLSIVRKFGFVQEGILREHYQINNQMEDSVVFGLLYHDYQKSSSNG